MTQAMQCRTCKHFWGGNKCEAYKVLIPKKIYMGEHDHTKPYKGDNGIRFEPIKTAD